MRRVDRCGRYEGLPISRVSFVPTVTLNQVLEVSFAECSLFGSPAPDCWAALARCFAERDRKANVTVPPTNSASTRIGIGDRISIDPTMTMMVRKNNAKTEANVARSSRLIVALKRHNAGSDHTGRALECVGQPYRAEKGRPGDEW